MKQFILLFIFFFSVNSFSQNKTEAKSTKVTTYYLIRHAEKDRTDKTNKNPHLTTKGNERAKRWAAIFEAVNFDAVYSTNYNRTIQTATPTAKSKNLDLQLYHPHKLDVKTFINATKGKTVLIVGHSNTTPLLANALLGKNKYEDINDNDNNNLYIVTISEKSKSSILLSVE